MTQETFNQIQSCSTMAEVDNILSTLKYGADYEEIDSKIDDGCNEDEVDEYVIKHSYRFFLEEENDATYVDFYYGNITFEIGYININ